MKETQKRILGCFGLGLVAVTTAVAATLPAPGASAVSSITDNIVVRVVGAVPDVRIEGVTNGAELTNPNVNIKLFYEHVGTADLYIRHANADGVVKTYLVNNIPEPDYETGERNIALNLDALVLCSGASDTTPNCLTDVTGAVTDPFADEGSAEPSAASASLQGSAPTRATAMDVAILGDGEPATVGGYGNYIFYYLGEGFDGATDSDALRFSYWPAIIEENPEDGTVNVEVNTDDDNIHDVVVIITDENGNEVRRQVVTRDEIINNGGRVPINVAGLPAGRYNISATAYNAGGQALYNLYSGEYISTEIPSAGSPDTGGLFQNLNISKEDYLITGLIVFFILGIVAFGVVAKNRGNTSTRKRK